MKIIQNLLFQEWELNDIKRDGTSDQKNTYEFSQYIVRKKNKYFQYHKRLVLKGIKFSLT